MTLTLEPTTTNGTHEYFDLDEALHVAITQSRQQAQAAEQAEQERAHARQRQREQHEGEIREALQARLDTVIPRAMQDALGFTIAVERDHACATFADYGDWTLEWNHTREQWFVTPPYGRGVHLSSDTLCHHLLVGIAHNRIETGQRRERLGTALLRSAELAEDIREAEAALRWDWPQDTTVTISHWRWSTSYDGSLSDSGYSLSDHLHDGWLHLEATAFSRARTVRLIPAYHQPVVERVVIRSLDEVPDCYGLRLLERVEVEVPGVGEVMVDHPDTGESVSLYRDVPDAVYTGETIERPVAWLRELAESGGLADAQPLPFEVTPQQVEVERLRGLITRAYHVITDPDRTPYSRELIEVLQEMEAIAEGDGDE